jgi:hypothetical protein
MNKSPNWLKPLSVDRYLVSCIVKFVVGIGWLLLVIHWGEKLNSVADNCSAVITTLSNTPFELWTIRTVPIIIGNIAECFLIGLLLYGWLVLVLEPAFLVALIIGGAFCNLLDPLFSALRRRPTHAAGNARKETHN